MTLRRAAAVLLLAAVVTGCASVPEPAPGSDVADRFELRDVPFHPQEKYQCGPAAAATVINDLGIEIEADDLVDEVYVPEREGSLPTEMRAAIRSRGLVAYPLAPSIDDVLRSIDAGYPVLVMQNLGLSWWPRWHYAVVVGYDLQASAVTLRSERDKHRRTGMKAFQNTWRRADYWAQVVVRPNDIPVTARPLDWLEAVHELEQQDHAQAAITGYRAATERWPLARPAWMARGNAAWQMDQEEEAVTAFARATELEPTAWNGWNNLAHVLDARGCGTLAARAGTCARRLAPDNDTANALLKRYAQAAGGNACRALPPCPAGL